MNFFEKVEQVPPDPIFGLNAAFHADPRETKVNLGVGVYRTADLKAVILETVKEAECRLLAKETSKDYLPIEGLADYIKVTKELVFGEAPERIYGAQMVGGTAALRVGGAFMRHHGYSHIYISDPTWANHSRIFHHAGFEVSTYPYFDYKHHRFNFEGLCSALNQMPKGSLVLLHACCHNPTGFDPSLEQWEEICEVMRKRELFPFFDFAYQGFGKDLESDASAVRHFVKKGLQCVVAVSHAKNFGLYAERAGALFFVCSSESEAKRVGSRIKMIIRGFYSNPPCHGARLVALILHDKELTKHWLEELKSMQGRINEMRQTLISLLREKTQRFDTLASQQGMFSYTGLNVGEVERLSADFGIYMTKDGRINVAGLNQKNVTYVAHAICETLSL